MTKLIKYFVSK